MNRKLVKIVTVSGVSLGATGIGLLLSSKSNRKKVRVQAHQARMKGMNIIYRLKHREQDINNTTPVPYYTEDDQQEQHV